MIARAKSHAGVKVKSMVTRRYGISFFFPFRYPVNGIIAPRLEMQLVRFGLIHVFEFLMMKFFVKGIFPNGFQFRNRFLSVIN